MLFKIKQKIEKLVTLYHTKVVENYRDSTRQCIAFDLSLHFGNDTCNKGSISLTEYLLKNSLKLLNLKKNEKES